MTHAGLDAHARTEFVREHGARDAVERQLADVGFTLPTAQAAAWLSLFEYSDRALVVARDAADVPRRAIGVAIGRSRALPGHRTYRVERLGAGDDADTDAALLEALTAAARADARCLRVNVDVFDRDNARRARLGAQLAALGYRRVSEPRMYERTVALDLEGTEDELFARIDKTARRHVRAPAKRGLELRPVTDIALASRIDALMQETFTRTGGALHRMPWDRIIAWSVAEPDVSRVIGLFDPRAEGADALISMAWGCAHGEYASYEAGAGVRRADLGSTPVNYAPLWDLIVWAKRDARARWFDFGGASAGDEHDALAGNLDFKRYFSEQIIPIAEEWFLEPHVLRARVAHAASAAATLVRRLRR